MKPTPQADHHRDPRRTGQRSLGAAEGVLVALRQCSRAEAFNDIVQTARQHSVAPLELADALVTIAEHDAARDFDDAVIAAVDQAWGALLRGGPSYGGDREQAQQPPMTVCTSASHPN